MFMNCYVFIFEYHDYISGAPIYYSNKIRFLKEKGWRTIVISCKSKGKTYVEGIRESSIGGFDFLIDAPNLFSKKELKKSINSICKLIPRNYNVVIETGTDWTAYWGELIAKNVGAQHYIFFLDEYNHRINKNNSKFFEFKYKRGELLCIEDNIMITTFSKFFKVKKPMSFTAWCTNSIKDFSSDLIEQINRSDYNIGYIGRLEKNCVMQIIENVIKFSQTVKPKNIKLIFFGGGPKQSLDKIKNKLDVYDNIEYFITGYMWPFPLKALKKCDLFIATAGSARVALHSGVPTVILDVLDSKPLYFLKNDSQAVSTLKNKDDKSIYDYIYSSLILNEAPAPDKFDFNAEWQIICNDFEKQLNYILTNNNDKKYYQTQNIKIGFCEKKLVKAMIYKTLGRDFFKKLREMILRNK